MTNEPTPVDLDSRVVELVRQHWEEHGKALLLSQLGGQGKIGTFAKQEAGSLAAYIRTRLANQVRLIQHTAVPELIGAIPADLELEKATDTDALLGRTRSQPTGSVRLHRAVWSAFRKPLEESKQRYLSRRPPFHFEDVPSGTELSDDFVEVSRSYVADPSADAPQVQREIDEWLTANDLDSTQFVVNKSARQESLPSDDLLGRLLAALEPDQLKRITMPLDVVDKLRRQRL